MGSTTDPARPLHVLAMTATLALTIAACADVEGVSHALGTRISRDRPECPQVWDTLPLFPDTSAVGRDPGGLTMVGASALAAPGPNTDIPEFHDCQKFIIEDGKKYDSLYAIFAATGLDSIVDSLGWENVVWASSNPAVAVVNGAGVVTAAAPGTVTITGTSVVDSSRHVAVAMTVTSPAANDTLGVMTVTSGAPAMVSMSVGQTITLAPALGKTTVSTMPVAEIYTYGPGYSPLGIGPNFNCLYIYFDATNTLAAKMVPVKDLGPSVQACHGAVNPNDAVGKTLEIKLHPVTDPNDLPPVARWDYDPVNKQQYVGIKCFDAWCEIGADGARPFSASPGFASRAGVSKGEMRVVQNKGWYDQQYLAISDAAGKSVPSRIKGTVIPDPDLKQRGLGHYKQGWVPVAYVGFDTLGAGDAAVAQYRTKFNFEPAAVTQLNEMNRLELCFGTRRHCEVPTPPTDATCADDPLWGWGKKLWWVKLVPAGGGVLKYRCITRRVHPNLPTNLLLPNTARWRWLVADETVWEECTQGCCETEVKPGSPMW